MLFIVIVPLNKLHRFLTLIMILKPFFGVTNESGIYIREPWHFSSASLRMSWVLKCWGQIPISTDFFQCTFHRFRRSYNYQDHASYVLADLGLLPSHKGFFGSKYGIYVVALTGLYWSFIYLLFNLSRPYSILSVILLYDKEAVSLRSAFFLLKPLL